MSISVISPVELAEYFESGKKIDLIDVCTPAEYRGMHVESACNIPLETLDPASVMQARNRPTEEPLYVICRTGNRGKQASEKFLSAGFANVVNVEGGIKACVEAGLPVVQGKKVLSLDRQVRITVGSIVVLGIALGWLVHPAFFGLSAFMGAGLIYAGISDTCALASLLARMPWNRLNYPANAECPCITSS
ncbi:MAG TPA: rhodanese-like domain-containing protein [Geobacteraceae bacterium]|nr:rhodanese-like domain-containing protein [Geobacteraceae bacterium]